MEERKNKSFGFQGFEMKKITLSPPVTNKRISGEFSTPLAKKARQFSPLIGRRSTNGNSLLQRINDTSVDGHDTPESGGRTPGGGFSTPGSGMKTPGSTFSTPGRGMKTPGSTISTPGSEMKTPGSWYGTPRSMVSISGSEADDSLNLSSPGTPTTPRLVFKTQDCAECSICSNQVFEVRHPHISSFHMMKNIGTATFKCQVCRIRHVKGDLVHNGRQSIVLGSSTLHNLWQARSYKSDFHIDFDTIIGGRIHDVHESFLLQFQDLTHPLDILLACGVNNIPTSDSAENIIFQFKSLVNTIKQHSKDNNHKYPNRVVICSILYAPKYCDPSLRYNNMLHKVRQVNRWIKEFNEGETGQHLNLHLYGVEGNPEVDPVVHKYEEWKEDQKFRKLHLSNFTKERVASDVIKLFSVLSQTV